MGTPIVLIVDTQANTGLVKVTDVGFKAFAPALRSSSSITTVILTRTCECLTYLGGRTRGEVSRMRVEWGR